MLSDDDMTYLGWLHAVMFLTKSVYYDQGGWINIQMLSYQYRKSHCGDKTILRPSYLHNGISYTGKMTSLYWIRTQLFHTLLLTVLNKFVADMPNWWYMMSLHVVTCATFYESVHIRPYNSDVQSCGLLYCCHCSYSAIWEYTAAINMDWKTMEILVFDILIFWKWLGTNHKQLLLASIQHSRVVLWTKDIYTYIYAYPYQSV